MSVTLHSTNQNEGRYLGRTNFVFVRGACFGGRYMLCESQLRGTMGNIDF